MDIRDLVNDAVNRYMSEITVLDMLYLKEQKIDSEWLKRSLIIMHILNEKELNAVNTVELDAVFSIKDIFETQLAGKKQNEFYDGYTGGKRRKELSDEIFAWDNHQKLIYGQLDSTFKIFNTITEKLGMKTTVPKWEEDEIPAGALPNLLFYLQEFYHPVMKAFRTDSYTGLTEQDWQDFSEKAIQHLIKQNSNRDNFYTELAAESVFHNTYLQASTNLATEIAELIVDDLHQTELHGDICFQLKVLDIYEDNFKKAILESRKAVQAMIGAIEKIQKDLADDLIDLAIEGKELNISIDEPQVQVWTQELSKELADLSKWNVKQSAELDGDLKKLLFKRMMKLKESKLKNGRDVQVPYIE